jgi:hypothetical protein
MTLTGRVERVNVDAEVDRLLGANPLPDLLNDTISANLVDLARLDDLEAAVAVVLIIRRSRQCSADSSMDVSVIGKKTFLRGMEEVGAVVDRSLFAGGATEDLGFPGVKMAVEVDDTDGTIVAVDGTKKRKSNGVITSQGDQTGQCSALLGRTGLVSVSMRRPAQQKAVTLLDLLKRISIIVSASVSAYWSF